jgi:hypothetical protein
MKAFWSVLIGGLILQIFVDAAFKVDGIALTMVIHKGIYFFTGFFILGFTLYFDRNIGWKTVLCLIVAMLVLDELVDFLRGFDDTRFLMFIHNAYMIAWGALCGYLLLRKMEVKQ